MNTGYQKANLNAGHHLDPEELNGLHPLWSKELPDLGSLDYAPRTQKVAFCGETQNRDEEDKAALYQVPYQNMVQFMFEMPNEQAFNSLYDKLKAQGTIFFLSTSFLRGLTFDNALIIVDECQNLNFHELDTIITRVGCINSPIIVSIRIEL